MDKLYKIAAARSSYISKHHRYKMIFWDKWYYSFLSKNIMYYRKKGRFQKGTWNDVIIGADTETSKGHKITNEPEANHVCAWTISIRAFHMNIVTLYGNKPSEMMECFKKIREALPGDEFIVYFHHLAYDYFFLRLFLHREFGTPIKELNTKPHYPIMLKFENGMILKDSLILAQCKLEKWASDLNVEHKKAVGSWDYDEIRDQDHKFSKNELVYIENDTLALVECLDALCVNLHKRIGEMVYTATGIVREEIRKIGEKNHAHDLFLRKAGDYKQQEKLEKLYHGGFSHSNRFYIGDIFKASENEDKNTEGADFNSSYPFCLIAFKYPGKFIPLDKDVKPDYIIRNSEKYGFIFRANFINIRLKDHYFPMPCLQSSKCEHTINADIDNGRIKKAGYVTLYLTEQDLIVIDSIYRWDECKCTEVEVADKEYLPRWFTDYVYERYSDKCKMKPKKAEDPVGYSLAKARVNLLYGLTVQKPCRENFLEVTEPGEYKINKQGDTAEFISGEYRIDFDKDPESQYEKYLNNNNTILNYTIGVYCTAYAFRNLFMLGDCVNKTYNSLGKLAYSPYWLYSDTDSCYSFDWNKEKIAAYNERCKALLRANGYGPVVVGKKEYWLGVAEIDPDDSIYTEFVTLGCKRYAGRSVKDNELHITVAGVPKKTGALCLEDDLSNFNNELIFDGRITGKLTHNYIFSEKGIYIDEFGNEIGDSIDLSPCNYALDSVDKEEFIQTDDYILDIFDEGGFDTYDR